MSLEKIIVERKKRFGESRYSVGIYIDGEFVVNTLESNSQEIELSVGKHILKVQQGNRSGEIEIEVKKGKTLACTFSATSLITFIYLSLMIALILNYTVPLTDWESLLALSPTLILTIYTFTIGKNAYFIFEKTTEDYSWLQE